MRCLILHGFLFSLVIILHLTPTTLALDNGLARTPPMGWLSWERYRCQIDCVKYPDSCISEKLYLGIAAKMASDGWRDVGYTRVNIDDCWASKERAPDGSLVADPTRFPSGIASLALKVKSLGVELGIYNDFGNKTCGGYPGSLGHLQQDANTFGRAFKVDSVKMDGCNVDISLMPKGYPEFGDYLNATGHPMMYSCSWPDYERIAGLHPNYSRIAEYCNIWRLYDDIQDSWASVSGIIKYWGDNQDTLIPAAGPGHFNDPDMLIVGDFSLNYQESRTQMALWCIWAAPLFMSNDLFNISDTAKTILMNKEAIAVNQDPLGIQGRRYTNVGGVQIWSKKLADGSYAMAVFNANDSPSSVNINTRENGIPFDRATLRSIWDHADMGTIDGKWSAALSAHDTNFYKLIPLSDETPTPARVNVIPTKK